MAGMTASGDFSFPPAALDWLIGAPGTRVLALGRSCAPLLAALTDRGHSLTASDPEPTGVRRLLAHAPRALPAVSDGAQLPFASGVFDVALAHQSFHTLDADEALPELARVLAPGGHLAVSYTVRDDSVPWVRRLVALLRAVDPEAMTGDYGSHSVAALDASPCFGRPERREFRLWSPISRAGMLALVRRRFPDLDAVRLAALLDQVGDLYDTSARPPEPLLLPYRVTCWRAPVDHTAVAPRPEVDEGLTISL